MIEIWKDIIGYEGVYQISNLGRIKSLSRTVRNNKSGSVRYIKEQVLSRVNTNSSGYLNICLYKGNKSKHFYIHRLVAEYFVEKIEGKNFVNHKNGIKTDNVFTNLEWCTKQENVIHAIETGLNPNDYSCKRVVDKSTGEEFKSIKIAAIHFKIPPTTLSHRLIGRLKNNTNLEFA